MSPFKSTSIFDLRIIRVWKILFLAFKKFLRIDGVQWAGAFSFNMFLSLFPLIVLFVTIASTFIDSDRAGKEIIYYIESYVPISGEMHNYIFNTISGVIYAREQAGLVAFVILVWAALPTTRQEAAWRCPVFQWPISSRPLPHAGLAPHIILLSF